MSKKTNKRSNKNTNKKKFSKNDKNDFVKSLRLPDIANNVFLFLIFGIYPVVMDNNYFNITVTRYHFFCNSTGFFVGLSCVAYIIEETIRRYYHYGEFVYNSGKEKKYANPEFYMLTFLTANLFSWLCAENKKAAFYGLHGRRMGFFIYILIAACFLIIAKRYKGNGYIYIVFLAASAFSFVVAICQHMENDFMGYKNRISPKQYTQFISTFGNINIFASFLSISIPVFMGIFIFAKNIIFRLAGFVLLVLSGVCILLANSDSVFIGMLMCMVLMFFLSYYKGYLRRFLFSLAGLATGNLILAFINKYAHTRYDKKRGGLALVLNRMDVAIGALALVLFLAMIVMLLRKRYGEVLDAWDRKKVMIRLAILGIGLTVLGIILGIASGSSYFRFDYEWGTYRGFIWRKVMELYGKSPLVNKIFGYGNDSLKGVLKQSCYREMMDVTGKVYDNAHNEVLQYLLTTGLLGAASYVALFVSSMIYMLKNLKDNVIIYVSLGVTASYFVQGLLNLNQPITTPFYFVFLAMGIGCVHHEMKMEEINCDNESAS